MCVISILWRSFAMNSKDAKGIIYALKTDIGISGRTAVFTGGRTITQQLIKNTVCSGRQRQKNGQPAF